MGSRVREQAWLQMDRIFDRLAERTTDRHEGLPCRRVDQRQRRPSMFSIDQEIGIQRQVGWRTARFWAAGVRHRQAQLRNSVSRCYTIGLHGVWGPETARYEAKVQLGRVAKGNNPAEERELDHKAVTV